MPNIAHGCAYRLVDFDAPEMDRARCDAERALGQRASHRLRQLVNAGGLDLHEIRCSCPQGTHGTPACNYGRDIILALGDQYAREAGDQKSP